MSPQRFLIISSLFPPDVIGGAEMSAYNLALWLRGQGAEVHILTTAKSRDEICDGAETDGLKIWRVWMPRPYPVFRFLEASQWLKPVWHLLDHFDPRNAKIVARVLDQVKPDIVNIHMVQGIGYNALREIARRNIKTVYSLHDLGLACIRMSMFKKGRDCERQCGLCKISSAYKESLIRKMPSLSFCSPSRATIERLSRYFPIKRWPHAAIMNVNSYPAASVARQESDHVRLLYAGRIHASKGVAVLFQAAQKLAATKKFALTIVGSGPDEAKLRKKYGQMPWCRFTGFVSQKELSAIMANSDVLCVPSLWAENSPGVAIHALSLGLPVITSDKGGLPELVEPHKNGLLVGAGDIQAWCDALATVIDNPSLCKKWRDYALANAAKFDQDLLGREMLAFINGDQGAAGTDSRTI